MNPYIEILRPGNALMGAISIVLIAIIDKTISIPIILAMMAVFFETAAGNVAIFTCNNMRFPNHISDR